MSVDNYYRHLTPGDPLCEAARDLRRDEYWLWQKYRPPLDADIELAAHELASRTGESPRRIINITCALHRLDELPQLKASQEEHFHLNFPRLIAIDDVLSKLGHPEDDVLERLDAAITAYLTPKSPGAALPSQANLRRKLHTLIMAEDDTILRKPRRAEDNSDGSDSPTEPVDESTYSVSRGTGASTALIAEFPDEIAASLDAVITQTARERNISAAAALAGLITRKFDPSPDVTLHVFRACDVDSAPVYVRGFGWMDPLIGDVLTASPTRVVDHTGGAKAKVTSPRIACAPTPKAGTAPAASRSARSRPCAARRTTPSTTTAAGRPRRTTWSTCASTTTTSRPTAARPTSSTPLQMTSSGYSTTEPGTAPTRPDRCPSAQNDGYRPPRRESMPAELERMRGRRPSF